MRIHDDVHDDDENKDDLTRVASSVLRTPRLDLPRETSHECTEALTVEAFRAVVRVELAILLSKARLAAPAPVVIARAQCESVLVERYAAVHAELARLEVACQAARDVLAQIDLTLEALMEAGT